MANPSRERSNVARIFQLMRWMHIHPAYMALPIALAIGSALFEGVGMGLLIPLLNVFLQKSFSFITEAPYIGPVMHLLPAFILENDRLLFGVLLAGFIVIQVLKNAFRYLSIISVAYFSERVQHHLRKVLFTRYLSFGKLFFDTTNIGHHNTLLLDFSRRALLPLTMADRYINSIFSLTAYFVMMLAISWKMTIFAVPLFFLLHIIVRGMIMSIRSLSRAIAQRGSELGKKSVEILSTIALVKSYRTEREEQGQYTRISDDMARMNYRASVFHALILPLQETITLLVAAGVFVGALAFFGRDQIASGSALVVYFYIVVNAASKFGGLSGFRGTLAASSGPLDEVFKIFDEEGKYFVKGGDKKFIGLKDSIVCRRLTFSYGEGREVLQDVSLTFERGKMTAVVGPTGSGKSTLISLLMRFYDCPPGSILIDGEDLRSFTLDSYLARVALVSQETLLLHDSLRNNITYGLENVPEEALQDAVRRARLLQFIELLPQGLETPIGDRGVKLSGGEKQRVSIARALLKGADILILDEATSSLDSQTEKLIQEAIDEAVQGRTSIVIAHRLSTIRNADKIVVIKDSRLVEEGALQELLEKQGAFHELWEQQKF
ncbi:MAG: ABC transporter ATP-binding protein [Candidatus Peribacteraceae bacterium]